MKIAVIGYSGSGKSTLAKILSGFYKTPILHLDCVQFKENWEMRDDNECQKIVADFMLNENWVIDGTYSKFLQKERFCSADYIIFLDFGRLNCFYRAFKRYIKFRGKTRDDMTDGCNEKMDREFIKWLLLDGRTKKRNLKFAEIKTQFSSKTLVIKNQIQLDKFIKKLPI